MKCLDFCENSDPIILILIFAKIFFQFATCVAASCLKHKIKVIFISIFFFWILVPNAGHFEHFDVRLQVVADANLRAGQCDAPDEQADEHHVGEDGREPDNLTQRKEKLVEKLQKKIKKKLKFFLIAI
jgi:hypothetical protein